ncbi:MAG: DUF167 domain-containing protein [Anaerolineaceae bacterium]|jgi:hypothetical protein
MKELHLTIKVIPNSPKTELVGLLDNEVLKIKVKGAPEKGKANHELIRFLEKLFDVKRGDVTLISGSTSRLKHVCISDKDQNDLQKIINDV